jgi:ABC-type antimicrobial peptide transport system permease subunit
VALLAAALAVAIAVAAHYRDQARHSTSLLPPHRALAGQVRVFVKQSPLPAHGALGGQVTVFVAQSSAGRAQVVVSALVTGARPHATYELVGNDCASNGPDHSWAAGVTDSLGSAYLIGHPWTVLTSDAYFLVLASRFLSRARPGSAVHGYFGQGPPGLSPVADGVAPCAALSSLTSARR